MSRSMADDAQTLSQFFAIVAQGYFPWQARGMLRIRRDHMERLGFSGAMMLSFAPNGPLDKDERPPTGLATWVADQLPASGEVPNPSGTSRT